MHKPFIMLLLKNIDSWLTKTGFDVASIEGLRAAAALSLIMRAAAKAMMMMLYALLFEQRILKGRIIELLYSWLMMYWLSVTSPINVSGRE